jgi:predicted phosphodiesterase
MRHTTPANTIARDYLKKHPNAASGALARMLHRDFPHEFQNENNARNMVRYLRGAKDGGNGKKYAVAPPTPFTASAFGSLPEGKTEFDDWHSEPLELPAKILVLSDIHLPYHQSSAVKLALGYGMDRGADTILCNGDTMDFYSVSFWEKDPRQRDLAAELKAGREFFAMLESLRKVKVVFKIGNHEERWERYLRVKAPELCGVDDFELSKILHLSKNVKVVGEKRPIQAGGLKIIHGHEYRFGIAAPVNPARGFFLRSHDHVLGGHLHQTSQHSENTIDNKVISCWSTGALCDLHPAYAPLNKWNHGFAFVEVDKKGSFEVSNLRIIDGKIY